MASSLELLAKSGAIVSAAGVALLIAFIAVLLATLLVITYVPATTLTLVDLFYR